EGRADEPAQHRLGRRRDPERRVGVAHRSEDAWRRVGERPVEVEQDEVVARAHGVAEAPSPDPDGAGPVPPAGPGALAVGRLRRPSAKPGAPPSRRAPAVVARRGGRADGPGSGAVTPVIVPGGRSEGNLPPAGHGRGGYSPTVPSTASRSRSA